MPTFGTFLDAFGCCHFEKRNVKALDRVGRFAIFTFIPLAYSFAFKKTFV